MANWATSMDVDGLAAAVRGGKVVVHIEDGVLGYWATLPSGTTEAQAKALFLETADYDTVPELSVDAYKAGRRDSGWQRLTDALEAEG